MTTQEIETINKLKQQFSDNFLGNSNEVEFTNFLNNLVSKGILTQGTAYNYHATKPKKFFKEYFGIDIFRVQKNDIEFLESCLKEMKDGNLARINRNREKGIDIPKFDGTPSASLEYYIKFLQQKGTDSKENKPTTEEDSGQKQGDTMNDKTKIPPLNQILYGPPGTGKTYSTIDKALEILRHYELIDEIPESREDKRAIFDEYRANKQIEFVTFHQSFSYEEFVEGIKPKLANSSEGVESNKMNYTIKSGIFKEICKSALNNLQDSQKDETTLNTENQVAKLFEAFIEHIQNEQENGKEYILDNEKNWFISILYSSSSPDYRIIKIFNNSGYKKYPHFLNDDKIKRYYKDFKSNHNFKIPSKENRTGYIDTHRFYTAFFKKMQEFETTWTKHNNQTKTNIDNALKPYILIIDEINRGNISKILGELITLIEPSKRIGASEELRVTLPYSGNEFDNGNGFGVPSNLYIIGTMNTADRSIALLDTALRRRFEFVEMMPDSSQLKPCGDIDLAQLLDKMNERIEFLLDREHTVGHSFFIGVDSLDKLREVFKLKIIPLLQEYFYDDYAKIQAVLNDNDMIKPKPKPEFLSKFSDEVNDEKVVYEIEKEWQKWELWQFVKIYNSKAKSQSQDSNKSDENE